MLAPISMTAGMTALRRLSAEASTYPGARLSDDGYHAWAFAIRTFRARIVAIVEDQDLFDDLNDSEFATLRADVVQDFPVEDYLV